jgi:chemotaxis protein CheZ
MEVAAYPLNKYRSSFEALAVAFSSGSESAFEKELDELLRLRERGLFLEIGKLTRDLNAALERFTLDSRLVDLAEKDVPDARQRLEHVLRLTDEAAHHTMDLVESACPLAERTGRAAAEIAPSWRDLQAGYVDVANLGDMLQRLDAFLVAAQADSETVRANLNEVLLAQGYQDLTGQIIRSVMALVGEVEHALGDLVRLSTADGGRRPVRAAGAADVRNGFGPAVPGIDHGALVSGQQDVDALLSGLGI